MPLRELRTIPVYVHPFGFRGHVGHFIQDPDSPVSPSTSTTSVSSERRAPRVQPKLTAKLTDGKAAHDFKSSFTGCASRWLKAYIFNRWGAHPIDRQYDRLARKVHRDMKLYIDEAKSGDVRTAKTRQACHARWAQVPGSPPKRTSPHCKYDPAGELHPTA